MKNGIRNLIGIFFLLFLFSLVSAEDPILSEHEQEIEEGRELVESKIQCEELTDKELEAIGEYYMELMHPGSLHEAMHDIMGLEEDSEEHKAFHITLAKQMYCGEYASSTSIMGYGMMGMMYGNSFWYQYWNFWNLTYLVFGAVIFATIFWAVYTFIKKEKGVIPWKKRQK